VSVPLSGGCGDEQMSELQLEVAALQMQLQRREAEVQTLLTREKQLLSGEVVVTGHTLIHCLHCVCCKTGHSLICKPRWQLCTTYPLGLLSTAMHTCQLSARSADDQRLITDSSGLFVVLRTLLPDQTAA
jgi:hypothetical protein